MSHVRVDVGLYKGCTARIIEECTATDGGRQRLLLVEFISGYRVRYNESEVTPIREM